MTPGEYPAKRRPGRRSAAERAAEKDHARVRAFVAVFPSPEAQRSLRDLRAHLEPRLCGLRWTAAQNLHFTLRFFGEISPEEVERAGAVVGEIAGMTRPFELAVSGLGVFPNWKRPRVLWAGCDQGGAVLEALARTLERGFREAGLGKADKRFVPHLTLGRWRNPLEVESAPAEEACKQVRDIATFRVGEVGVIQSVLSPQGSRYTPLVAASLGG